MKYRESKPFSSGTEVDDAGNVVSRHYCKRFESIRVDLTRLHSIALDCTRFALDSSRFNSIRKGLK